MGTITGTLSSRVRIVVALYYEGLYGDFSDRYLGVKNSNKNSSEFLTLSPSLNLWCFLSIFGRFIGRFQRVLVLPLFVIYTTYIRTTAYVRYILNHVMKSVRGTQRQFSENICSEDDLRSRISGTFVVKFLACLLLLGFPNI